jgi:hypothetical protein
MGKFVSKMTNTITIKTNQWKLTFISGIGSLVQSSEISLMLICSFYFSFFFDLLDSSFIFGFFYLVLISYAVKIPCSSSMLIESRSALSSSVDILRSNLIGRDLSTF